MSFGIQRIPFWQTPGLTVYGTFKLTYIFAVDQNKPPVQNINIFGGQVVIGDDGAIHQEGIYHRIF